MRVVFAVALCFVLGACATFGGREPDIYGEYHLETSQDATVWIRIEEDGSLGLSISSPMMSEDEYWEGGYSIVEEKDGCFWGEFWADIAPEVIKTISICNEVLTVIEDNQVFHKRH